MFSGNIEMRRSVVFIGNFERIDRINPERLFITQNMLKIILWVYEK